MKKITCVALQISVALLFIGNYAKAGSCAAIGTGNWETPGNWSCGNVPGAGDDVTIGAGITVTVNANNLANIGNLDIFGILKFTNGSKIDLGTSSLVNIYSGGSIIGGNGGAKLVFPSTSYSGAFSTTGPFYYSNNGFGTGLLPLVLLSFYGSQQNQELILYWTTANEENIKSFEIESSGNGNADWQLLEIMPSMATGGNGFSYRFIDQTKNGGDRYYRLKMVDNDGKYAYSKILPVTSGYTGTMSVSPTLVYSSINVTLPTTDPARVYVFNSYGQLIKTLITGNEVFNMDISGLNRGVYFLQASQGKNSYTTKFIKQ